VSARDTRAVHTCIIAEVKMCQRVAYNQKQNVQIWHSTLFKFWMQFRRNSREREDAVAADLIAAERERVQCWAFAQINCKSCTVLVADISVREIKDSRALPARIYSQDDTLEKGCPRCRRSTHVYVAMKEFEKPRH